MDDIRILARPRFGFKRAFQHPLVLLASVLLAYFVANISIAKPTLGAFLRSDSHPLDFFLYVLLCSLSGLSLASALVGLGRFASATLGILVLVCLGTNYAVGSIVGIRPLDPSTAQWLLGEIAQTGDALKEFAPAVGRSFGFAVLLAVPFTAAVLWARRRIRSRLPSRFYLPLGVAGALLYLASS